MNNLLSLKKESIDSGFDRFNTIIISLKALDEGFSSKNYVRKFLRALRPKWRTKVMAIEESKDLSSLALDELIGNLKVYEVVMEKDSEIYKGKKERIKSITLKSKKESSDDETSTSGRDDEESSTNEVSPASGNFRVNTARGTSSSSQVSSTPGADEVVCSFFAQQTTNPPLDNEDLQQIDQDDLYSNKHNMVAFLKKPTESVGFTEIVDFLKGTSLRYALTHNPTIYDSLVKLFWQSTTVRTLANGVQELVASIDNKEYTITKASIRSQLQLADATGEHIPLLPAMLAGAAPNQGEGSAILASSQPIPDQGTEIPQSQGPTVTLVADEATTTGVGIETERATTTTTGLDAGLDSGNIHESTHRSHEAPLHEDNTSGSAEDSLNIKELMGTVPKLVLRIDNLEEELEEEL
ncbi:hypothetical protein Tco_0012494 [Tanacetum coccineum]